ncbi:MAG TPA: addiction module protein [Sulfurovum sp.]|uniref:addiction module protein n=1 Tax=Sulfurovum sp. TaxID=1969726 RepID=UPI002F952D58
MDEIFSDILPLSHTDKLLLVDRILASLYPANRGVEAIWKDEAEERLEAYDQGDISTADEKDIFIKYKR